MGVGPSDVVVDNRGLRYLIKREFVLSASRLYRLGDRRILIAPQKDTRGYWVSSASQLRVAM